MTPVNLVHVRLNLYSKEKLQFLRIIDMLMWGFCHDFCQSGLHAFKSYIIYISAFSYEAEIRSILSHSGNVFN